MLARPSIHTLDKADIYTERWLNEEIISVPGSIEGPLKSQKQDYQIPEDLIATLTAAQRIKSSHKASALLFQCLIPRKKFPGTYQGIKQGITRGNITRNTRGIPRGISVSGNIERTFEITEIGP